jgi:glycerol-3-phosphate acyltransferase PlsX
VKAYEWLTKQGKKLPFSFLGNAEPREFFSGELDALVTNGFTGNILLKTAEAVSDFLIESIEKNFPSGQSPDALLPFTELRQVFSQDDALGAILYGVDGYVFKCHGAATTRSLQRAMIGATGLVQKDLLKATKSFLAKHLS